MKLKCVHMFVSFYQWELYDVIILQKMWSNSLLFNLLINWFNRIEQFSIIIISFCRLKERKIFRQFSFQIESQKTKDGYSAQTFLYFTIKKWYYFCSELYNLHIHKYDESRAFYICICLHNSKRARALNQTLNAHLWTFTFQ